MRRYLVLGLIFFLAIIFLGKFSHGTMDGFQRAEVARSLLVDHQWASPYFGPSKYGPLQPLLMVPFYALGYSYGLSQGASQIQLHFTGIKSCASLFMPLVTAILCVLFYRIQREMDWSAPVSLVSTALLFLGTFFLPYSRILFSEPLNALFILSSFYFFWRSLSGNFVVNNRYNFLFLVLLCLNNFIFEGYFGLMLLYVFASSYVHLTKPAEARRAFGEGLGMMGVSIAISLYYNFIRYGSVWTFGYEDEGFTTPVLEGVYGLFFSFGRGLVVYSSITVVCLLFFLFNYQKIETKLRFCLGAFGVSFVFYVLLYCKWGTWSGGYCWGPRYLLPFLPVIHLIFPYVWKSVQKANVVVKGLGLVLILWAIFLNGWEYVGLWDTFQSSNFGKVANAKPYWYALWAPEYSFLFNNGEWKDILPSLGRFFVMAVLLGLSLWGWVRWSELTPDRSKLRVEGI